MKKALFSGLIVVAGGVYAITANSPVQSEPTLSNTQNLVRMVDTIKQDREPIPEIQVVPLNDTEQIPQPTESKCQYSERPLVNGQCNNSDPCNPSSIKDPELHGDC